MDENEDAKAVCATGVSERGVRLYAVEEIKREVHPWRNEALEDLESSQEIPGYLKTSTRFQDLWFAGCWLNEKLEQTGASEAQAKDIGVVHGQHSFFGDPWKWAAKLLFDFVSGQEMERPGDALADDINAKCIKVNGGIIAIATDEPEDPAHG